MRAITKGQQPRSLIRHQANTHADYANYAEKDDLRSALVRDQRGLCCYCMARIEPTATGMKIEHWRCQEYNREFELSYSNLLAACLGGHGQPKDLQHCDTRKGKEDLKYNPADPLHRIEQRIRFELDGAIASSDADFDVQLNKVLGLNSEVFKNWRKGMLTGILEWWKREKARLNGPVPRERLIRERTRRAGERVGDLSPSDVVAVWWIDQRLARSAA